MKTLGLRSLASILVVSVALLGLGQTRAEAMLAPAEAVQDAPQIDRTADLAVIQSSLESKLLQKRLQALGLSEAEIQSRLSRLSDAEVHQLASQMRAVRPAGNVLVGVLVLVVLVLLIIFLVKRV